MSSNDKFTPYGWLTSCPSGDCNFKAALKNASDADLKKAHDVLALGLHSKTAVKAIEAEQRRRQKKARQCTSTDEPEQ